MKLMKPVREALEKLFNGTAYEVDETPCEIIDWLGEHAELLTLEEIIDIWALAVGEREAFGLAVQEERPDPSPYWYVRRTA